MFLLSGFLICHAVGWYIELKNQTFRWRTPERKTPTPGHPKDLQSPSKPTCDPRHHASKQPHNTSAVPLPLQTESPSGEQTIPSSNKSMIPPCTPPRMVSHGVQRKTMSYNVGNSGLGFGEALICGGIKVVNRILTYLSR